MIGKFKVYYWCVKFVYSIEISVRFSLRLLSVYNSNMIEYYIIFFVGSEGIIFSLEIVIWLIFDKLYVGRLFLDFFYVILYEYVFLIVSRDVK